MAKAYFKCARCGASIRADGCNRSEAYRKAGWRESQGHICDDCEAKARAVENAKAVEANKQDGLPALTGTEKQALWAETIRAKMLPEVRALAEKSEAGLDRIAARDYPETATAEQVEGARIECERVIIAANIIESKTKASWWIDNRSTSIGLIITGLKAEIDEAMAIAATAPTTPEEAQIAEAAQEEVLLKPAGDPVSPQIAEIKFTTPFLRVAFPEKNESFRLLMRGMGFKWEDRYWQRQMTHMTGNPIDRIAETAHRLIAAGFMARIHDDDARVKAISGEFEPEQTRWVARSVGGSYDGWFSILWPKSDDLYAPAKRILGARYKNGAVYVPPGSAEEISEFAEKYGFALSVGAAEMIEAHRTALANGIILDDPKKTPAPLRVKDAGKPAAMDASTAVIDNELLDN